MMKDENYRKCFEEATDEAADLLEEEARRRAVEGVFRFKFDKNGNPLVDPRTSEPYQELEYSDTLLIFLLKGARPEKFCDRQRVFQEGGLQITQKNAGDEYPAPRQHLANAFGILQELNLFPKFDSEAEKLLLSYHQESNGNGDGESPNENGNGNGNGCIVMTPMPETLRRTPSQGRKRGKAKKDKNKPGSESK